MIYLLSIVEKPSQTGVGLNIGITVGILVLLFLIAITLSSNTKK